jgi:hypothetical protein
MPIGEEVPPHRFRIHVLHSPMSAACAPAGDEQQRSDGGRRAGAKPTHMPDNEDLVLDALTALSAETAFT